MAVKKTDCNLLGCQRYAAVEWAVANDLQLTLDTCRLESIQNLWMTWSPSKTCLVNGFRMHCEYGDGYYDDYW